jgi:hypothetical protein
LENLFYTPSLLGFVFDIGDFFTLEHLKKIIISFVQGLDAETENKVYIYRPEILELNRWLSESIVDIAKYQEDRRIDPEKSLVQTIKVLGIDDENANKHVLYFTDRGSNSRHRRVSRALNLDSTLNAGCHFWLIEMGTKPDVLLQASSLSHPRTSYHLFGHGDITPQTLKEMVYAENHTSHTTAADAPAQGESREQGREVDTPDQ